jgi:hypothetical protein
MEESATIKVWRLATISMLGLRPALSTLRAGGLTHHVFVIVDKI